MSKSATGVGIPINTEQPVAFDAPLPASADVVVIGGGVIGVTTALYLARDGLTVVLLEKGRIAGEQSSRNWGWIRQQGRDPDELPIMVEANRLWRSLAKETNVDIGLRQAGVTYLARSERDLERYADWVPHAQAHGVGSRLLSRAETEEHLPGMSRVYAGALHTATDMRAEPWRAVPALAHIAAREGVTLVENCAVRMLDLAGGRVSGVETERGRIAASEVVLAGGAWSALFLQRHGVFLPQLSVRASVAQTQAVKDIHAGAVAESGVAFRRREDGGYSIAAGGFNELYVGPHAVRATPKFIKQLMAEPFGTRLLPWAPRGYPDAWGTPRAWPEGDVSPFERMRILDPSPNMTRLARAAREFGALFPQLGPVRLKRAWAGMIDTMPDIVPVVDRVPELPGLTLGTGMSGHGFGIGPGMGRVLSALVQNRAPGHDLSRFRFGRFADGSAIELGPAL